MFQTLKRAVRAVIVYVMCAAIEAATWVGVRRTSLYGMLPKRLQTWLLEAPLPSRVHVTVRGRTLEFATAPASELDRAYYWRGFETFEALTTRFVLDRAPTYAWFCDVGAHIGHYTLAFAVANTTAPIRSFEPHPHNADALQSNLERNGIANATVVRAALGDTDGTATLFVPARSPFPLTSIGSLRPRFRGDGRFADRGEVAINVAALSARRAFADLPPGQGLIKIDAEGSEGDILAAAEPFLRATHPRSDL